jgi:hypothetical protein
MTVRRRIDRERTLVHAAIRLVARGASRRVTLTGLRHGDRILAEDELLRVEPGIEIQGDPREGPARTIVVEADTA